VTLRRIALVRGLAAATLIVEGNRPKRRPQAPHSKDRVFELCGLQLPTASRGSGRHGPFEPAA
jgi:hypothetical protein